LADPSCVVDKQWEEAHFLITQHAVYWTFGGYVTAHLNFSGYLCDLNVHGKPHVKIAFED